jgi:hypothetical protein
MINPSSILIWDGRLHLGDEPGIHGSSDYVGLSTEFPLTAKPYPGQATGAVPDLTLILEAQDVNIYQGYLGHLISLTGYAPIDPADPVSRWREIAIQVGPHELHPQNIPPDTKYLSLRIRVATDVPPGLYDDFIIARLSYQSKTHYVVFGFRE